MTEAYGQCWRAGGRVAGLLPKASRSNDFVAGRSSGVRECLSRASSQGVSGSPRSGQAGGGGGGGGASWDELHVPGELCGQARAGRHPHSRLTGASGASAPNAQHT